MSRVNNAPSQPKYKAGGYVKPKRNAAAEKAKYTKQRKDDESIVGKAYKKEIGTGRAVRGKQTDKARSDLTVIGNKIFGANNPSPKTRKKK